MQHAAITPQGNPDYEADDARARSVDDFLLFAPDEWLKARAKEVLTDEGLETYLIEAWANGTPAKFGADVIRLFDQRATEQAYGEVV